MVIDFHVHAFPDELAARAIPKMAVRAGVPAYYDGTVRGLLDSMRRSGVDHAVIQPVATRPDQVEGINLWAKSLRGTPGLTCFGALHPDLDPEALARHLDFLKREGFKGIKLHPDYQSFHPDEDRLEPLYAGLAAAGLAVLFHAGIDLGLYPPLMSTPEQIARVQRAFPTLRIIAAHLGGFRLWPEVERHLVGTPVWLDTAYCALECAPEQLRDIVRGHGARKVLFASDGPWGDQAGELAYVRSAGLSAVDLAAITGGNAQILLGLDDDPK